jgi:hypothetical protein
MSRKDELNRALDLAVIFHAEPMVQKCCNLLFRS